MHLICELSQGVQGRDFSELKKLLDPRKAVEASVHCFLEMFAHGWEDSDDNVLCLCRCDIPLIRHKTLWR